MIHAPSAGALDMIRRRSGMSFSEDWRPGAIGLVQGRVIEMIFASDVAQKSVDVDVFEIRGSCPQNMTVLGIAGDTASVEEALRQVQAKRGDGL